MGFIECLSYLIAFVSSVNEVFKELPDEVVSVFCLRVVVVESSKLAEYKSFECRRQVCGAVWDVKMMIVGFFIYLVFYSSVDDCECEVEEVDRSFWFFCCPG